ATGYGERGLPETYRSRPVLQKPFARDDLERVLQTLGAYARPRRAFLLGIRNVCLIRPIFCHGSRRRRASRLPTFCNVKAFGSFCAPNSSQVSGTDTVAPERARVE